MAGTKVHLTHPLTSRSGEVAYPCVTVVVITYPLGINRRLGAYSLPTRFIVSEA